MFANAHGFKCLIVRMFACSLIRPLSLCSYVRMFAEHERTFEHWTKMFDVRWPLFIISAYISTYHDKERCYKAKNKAAYRLLRWVPHFSLTGIGWHHDLKISAHYLQIQHNMLNIFSRLKAIFLIQMSNYHKIVMRKSLNPYGWFFGTVTDRDFWQLWFSKSNNKL